MSVQKIYSSNSIQSINNEDFDKFEKVFDKMINEQEKVFADPCINEKEKELVHQLRIGDEDVEDLTDEILAALDQLLTEHSDSPYAYYYHCLKGLTLIDSDPEGAIQSWSESIQLNPQFAPSYLFRGLVYLAQNHFQQGMEDLAMVDKL